jgi:hypothetical protein
MADIGTTWQSDNFGTLTVVAFESVRGIDCAIVADSTGRRIATPVANLERQIYVDTKNLESRTRQREQAAAEREAKASHDRWFGFTDGMAPIKAGKIRAVLEKRVSFGKEPGERGILIAEMVRKGYRPEGVRFMAPDGGSFYEVGDLTQTGWAFAEYIIGKL